MSIYVDMKCQFATMPSILILMLNIINFFKGVKIMIQEIEIHLEYRDLHFNIIVNPKAALEEQITELFKSENISDYIDWDEIKIVGVNYY